MKQYFVAYFILSFCSLTVAFPPSASNGFAEISRTENALAVDGTSSGGAGNKIDPTKVVSETDPSTATIMQQLMEIASSAGATNSGEYFKELCQVKDAMLTIVNAIDNMLSGNAFGGEPFTCKVAPSPLAPANTTPSKSAGKSSATRFRSTNTGDTDNSLDKEKQQLELVKKMKEVVDFIPMTDADMEAAFHEAALKQAQEKEEKAGTAVESGVAHQAQDAHNAEDSEAAKPKTAEDENNRIQTIKQMLEGATKMQQVKQIADMLRM